MADRNDHDEAARAAEDKLLAARAADGDGAAVERLYDAYEKRLFNYCHRITNNREDAADATQEAFCNVIARLPGLDTAQLNFAAYLYTAARNACMDLIKAGRRAEVTDDVPEDALAVAPVETDPERVVLTLDQQRAAREANSRLPETQRTALAMREIAELSYEDIATALEMNSNSVAQLISRARLNFFKQLRAEAVAIPPLDEAGQRAVNLVVERMDGKIGEDDLDWLERHLAENEASRINAEAMQESAVLYRGIAPVAVIATLKGATLARAAEPSHSGQATGKASRGSQADVTTVMPFPSGDGAGTAFAAGPDDDATDGPTDAGAARHSRRRRVLSVATVMAVAVAVSLAVVAGLGESDVTPVDPASDNSAVAASGGDEANDTGSSKRKKSRDAKSGPLSTIPLIGDQATIPGITTPKKKKSGGGKVQSKGDKQDPAPTTTDPAPPAPDPDPPAPQPDPTPSTPDPTRPTGQPTPPTSCRKPPCVIRPPTRPPTTPPTIK